MFSSDYPFLVCTECPLPAVLPDPGLAQLLVSGSDDVTLSSPFLSADFVCWPPAEPFTGWCFLTAFTAVSRLGNSVPPNCTLGVTVADDRWSALAGSINRSSARRVTLSASVEAATAVVKTWISEWSQLEPREPRSSVALRLEPREPRSSVVFRLDPREPPSSRLERCCSSWLHRLGRRSCPSSWLLRLDDRSSGRSSRLFRLEDRWSSVRSMLQLLLSQGRGRLCFSSSSWSVWFFSRPQLVSTTVQKKTTLKGQFNSAGHVTILLRQRYTCFKATKLLVMALLLYYIRSGHSIYRHQDPKIFVNIYLAHEALFCFLVDVVAKLYNCCVPSSAVQRYFH